MQKELIALDIDGTLTANMHSVPAAIEHYLESLAKQGVQLVLVTGRSFSLAFPPLAQWRFPYLLAVHNGAVILQMPEKIIASKHYIDPDALNFLDQIAADEKTDFALYTGIENDDICYFRPGRFSIAWRDYMLRRAQVCKENWVAVNSFNADALPLKSIVAIKFFAKRQSAFRIQKAVERRLQLHIPVIEDPFDRSVYIAQATHPGVDKGSVIDKIIEGSCETGRLIIAAGDDTNDLPMLNKADVKIVMGSASEELKKIADLVAKPAAECGIIEALEYARNNWV